MKAFDLTVSSRIIRTERLRSQVVTAFTRAAVSDYPSHTIQTASPPEAHFVLEIFFNVTSSEVIKLVLLKNSLQPPQVFVPLNLQYATKPNDRSFVILGL